MADLGAGTPGRLDPPLDDERLLMLALEEGKNKRSSVWHVHVLETTEEAVNSQINWYVRGVKTSRHAMRVGRQIPY